MFSVKVNDHLKQLEEFTKFTKLDNLKRSYNSH